MRRAPSRSTALPVLVLSGTLLVACGPNPAGSGGLVGQVRGTSDVEGQRGDPGVGGGGIGAVPISALDAFWQEVGEEPVTDPAEWSSVRWDLTRPDVQRLGGVVAEVEEDGAFRLHASPGEHVVCYWPSRGEASSVTGCDAVVLPEEGGLDASIGEAGFDIRVAD
jgi:hypothetical protein